MNIYDVPKELKVGNVYGCDQVNDFVSLNKNVRILCLNSNLIDNKGKVVIRSISEGFIIANNNGIHVNHDSKNRVYIAEKI